MRFPLWPLAAVLLVFAGAAARAEERPDPVVEARECIGRLSSPEADVRRKAAERIAALGVAAVEEAARGGADLGAEAWQAFSGACERRKSRGAAARLVAAAHSAPEAHRRRLLELARRLDPEAGKDRTPAEVEAKVREIVGRPQHGCVIVFDEELVLLGHDAVAPLLAMLCEPELSRIDESFICWALCTLAEREDVPALRDALLQGRTALASPLARLRERGVTEAEDAIYAAASSVCFDRSLADALESRPDQRRSAEAVLVRIKRTGADGPSEGERCTIAKFFEKIDARAALPTLEGWVASSREPSTLCALGSALTRLGSRRGIEVLVHIVEERPTRFPCRPSTPEEEATASAPGRMCAEGFHTYERCKAVRVVSGIAGQEVFATPTRKRDGVADWDRADDATLDRAAVAFRAWWDASKDRLRFDPAAGSWSLAD